MTIAEFKTAAINTDAMPDASIEELFLNFEVTTEQELMEMVVILKKYRPQVYEKLSATVTRPV